MIKWKTYSKDTHDRHMDIMKAIDHQKKYGGNVNRLLEYREDEYEVLNGGEVIFGSDVKIFETNQYRS